MLLWRAVKASEKWLQNETLRAAYDNVDDNLYASEINFHKETGAGVSLVQTHTQKIRQIPHILGMDVIRDKGKK